MILKNKLDQAIKTVVKPRNEGRTHRIETGLVITLFLLGVFFRLWLAGLVPQPLIFDQEEYHRLARSFLTANIYDSYISSYRTYGYPLILAMVYHFFGMENRWAWIILQALFDASCAFFIYQIAKKIFEKSTPAWIVYILYLFNPFTSAFVGVRLTEITTIFLVTLIFFLFLLSLEKRNSFYLFPLAFALGFLPFVRPGFLYFSLVTMGMIIYLVHKYFTLKGFLKDAVFILMIFLFISPFVYNLARNLVYFQQFSLLTVDNLFVKQLYLSLYIDNLDTDPIPPQMNWVYQEYFTARDKSERKAMADKYMGRALKKIREDPWLFIVSRLRKIRYVWEKHALFPYGNPKNIFLDLFVYWGNIVLLALSFFGLAHWTRKALPLQDKEYMKWFTYLSIFLVLYISILHTFVITVGRFSLPAYPLIFLFAGYGIWRLGRVIKVKHIAAFFGG